jgi:deazaflavin-dependent oxidoreductase (nitroreductase family)
MAASWKNAASPSTPGHRWLDRPLRAHQGDDPVHVAPVHRQVGIEHRGVPLEQLVGDLVRAIQRGIGHRRTVAPSRWPHHAPGRCVTPNRNDPPSRRVVQCMTNDWNKKIIAEFRGNGGKVGGRFEGMPLLLLHSTGAKSGERRVNPMAYQDLGGSYAVFASYAGAPRNPDWYHNVVANPDVEVEVGTDTVRAQARVAQGDERSHIWEKQKADYPGFAGYEAETDREIPVVVLEPVA